MTKRKTIDVSVRLPKETIAVLDALAASGVLGDTRDAVALYVLRTFIFERLLRPSIPMTPKSKP